MGVGGGFWDDGGGVGSEPLLISLFAKSHKSHESLLVLNAYMDMIFEASKII